MEVEIAKNMFFDDIGPIVEGVLTCRNPSMDAYISPSMPFNPVPGMGSHEYQPI
jgi:hypothetical protein